MCSFVLKTHTELLFDHIKQDTNNMKAHLDHPYPLLQRCQPSEDGRQCLLISYLALEMTELLLMYKTLHCISFSGTDEPE